MGHRLKVRHSRPHLEAAWAEAKSTHVFHEWPLSDQSWGKRWKKAILVLVLWEQKSEWEVLSWQPSLVRAQQESHAVWFTPAWKLGRNNLQKRRAREVLCPPNALEESCFLRPTVKRRLRGSLIQWWVRVVQGFWKGKWANSWSSNWWKRANTKIWQWKNRT